MAEEEEEEGQEARVKVMADLAALSATIYAGDDAVLGAEARGGMAPGGGGAIAAGAREGGSVQEGGGEGEDGEEERVGGELEGGAGACQSAEQVEVRERLKAAGLKVFLTQDSDDPDDDACPPVTA